jgi:glycosyltransferase involved in cell wall biosynthesis
MIVAHWNMRFFPLVGGIETHIASLIRNMPDVQFCVVTNALKGESLKSEFSENAGIHRFRPYDPMRARKTHWGSKVLLAPSSAAEILRTLRQRLYIKKRKPDLVHLHDIDRNTIEILRRFGSPKRFVQLFNSMFKPDDLHIPFLLTKHFDTMLIPDSPWAAWEKSFTLQYQNVIVLSKTREEFWRREFEERGIEANIWYVPNGVDLDIFSPVKVRADRPFTVGYAGRLDVYKGESLLAEILEHLPEGVNFHGAISARERIPSWLTNLPADRFKVSYNIPYNLMPDFYRSLDLVMNTTIIRTTDRAILEAMACGTPLIKVRTGDDSPVIDRETGMLLAPRARDFNDAIDSLRSDRQSLERLSRNAHEAVANSFDAKAIACKVRDIYQTLAGQ